MRKYLTSGLSPRLWWERGGREVGEVEGNDHIGVDLDGGREDMAVLRVGQGQGVDERLIVFDQTIADMGLHERPGARQLRGRQIGPVRQQMTDPLVDPLRPLRAV